MIHAAKIRIISHTTKLFPIFFISNQSSKTCFSLMNTIEKLVMSE